MVLTSKNMKSLKPQGRIPRNTLQTSRTTSNRPMLIHEEESLNAKFNASMFKNSRDSLRSTQSRSRNLTRNPRRSATSIPPPSGFLNSSDPVEIHDISDEESKETNDHTNHSHIGNSSESSLQSTTNTERREGTFNAPGSAESQLQNSSRPSRSISLINQKIPLLELISVSLTHESTTAQPDMTVEVWPGKLQIQCESADINLNVPYHLIRYIRVPTTHNKRHTLIQIILASTLVYTQNTNTFEYTEFFLGLKDPWDNAYLKQFEDIVNQSRIRQGTEPNLTIGGFNSRDYLKIGRTWDPATVGTFYPSNRNKPNKPSTKAIRIKPNFSMDTDFSSLNRRERTQRTRTTTHYENEESDEERASEQMVFENGASKIHDFVPEDQQIYFHPKLKYKFDNNKTFTITNDDFNCLYNGNWINDALVDFFLRYQLQLAKEKKVNKADKIEIFNSFFFTSLSRPVDDNNYYKNVKSWFKKDDTLFDKEFVIIPIMQDLHWYCIVITDLKLIKRRHSKMLAQKDSKAGTAAENNDNDGVIKGAEEINSETSDSSEEPDILSQPHGSRSPAKGKRPQMKELDDEDNLNKLSDDNEAGQERDYFADAKETINEQQNEKSMETDKDKPPKPTIKLQTAAHICILDSLRRNHEKEVEYIKHFLREYAAEKYGFKILSAEITKRVCMVPQQKNFNDCGIHVLFNVETMLADPTTFNKVVLKRPFVRKQTTKIRKENHDMFNADKRLYLRDNLRKLLIDLLKKQVEINNGDLSQVCNLTVKEKRIMDLKDSKIVSETLEDNGAKPNSNKPDVDAKSNVTGKATNGPKSDNTSDDSARKGDERNADDSEDDLVIVHAEDKNPGGPDLELSKVEPALMSLKIQPKVKVVKPLPTSFFQAVDELNQNANNSNSETSADNLKVIKKVSLGRNKIVTTDAKKMGPVKRKQDTAIDSNGTKEVVKRRRGRSRKVFDNPISLSDDTRVAVRARNPRLRSSLASSQSLVISDDEMTENDKDDQAILSQDSYHNNIDFSPIKLSTTENEGLNITEQIDEELKSSVSPTPSSVPPELVQCDDSAPAEIVKTSSEKLMDDVDSALKDSRYNTPLSPINLHLDSDHEDYGKPSVGERGNEVEQVDVTLSASLPSGLVANFIAPVAETQLREAVSNIDEKVRDPQSKDVIHKATHSKSTANNPGSERKTTLERNEEVAVIDIALKEEQKEKKLEIQGVNYTKNVNPTQKNLKKMLQESNNDISPVKVVHDLTHISQSLFVKNPKSKPRISPAPVVPVSSSSHIRESESKLKPDLFKREVAEPRKSSVREGFSTFGGKKHITVDSFGNRRDFSHSSRTNLSKGRNWSNREVDLFPSIGQSGRENKHRISRVPTGGKTDVSLEGRHPNTVDLTYDKSAPFQRINPDSIKSATSTVSEILKTKSKGGVERKTAMAANYEVNEKKQQDTPKPTAIKGDVIAVRMQQPDATKKRNLRSTSLEPEVISYSEAPKEQIVIESESEAQYRKELEQTHIENIEKAVSGRLLTTGIDDDITLSGSLSKKRKTNVRVDEPNIRRRLRPRVRSIQDRIDEVAKNIPRRHIGDVWLGDGFIERFPTRPGRRGYPKENDAYVVDSEEESPSFQPD